MTFTILISVVILIVVCSAASLWVTLKVYKH